MKNRFVTFLAVSVFAVIAVAIIYVNVFMNTSQTLIQVSSPSPSNDTANSNKSATTYQQTRTSTVSSAKSTRAS